MTPIFKEVMKSQSSRASVLVVLIYGLLLGYFVWHTFIMHKTESYTVNWQAPWIVYSEKEVSQSYYRKTIYITENISNAWIKIMAPDGFHVYVNGNLIGKHNRLFDNVTQFFDLTNELKRGTNVIAVSNTRNTHPGNSQIVVEGVYENWQGVKYKIRTDGTWKVSRRQEWQYLGGPEWFDPAFDDVFWKYAQATAIPGAMDNSKVTYNPLVYTDKIRGKWIWLPSMTGKKATFQYQADIQGKIADAWIRIATYQSYSLFINGVLVESIIDRVRIADTSLASKIRLDVHNITPFLTSGQNVLTVTTESDNVRPGILVDGFFIDKNHQVNQFSTPDSWEVAIKNTQNDTETKWQPALSIGNLAPVQSNNLIKNIVDSQPTVQYSILTFLKQSVCIGIVAVVILFAWVKFVYLLARIKGIPWQRSLSMTGMTYILPGVVLVIVILFGFDMRFDLAYPFQPKWCVLSISLLLILQSALFLDKKSSKRERSHQTGKPTVTNTTTISISSVIYQNRFALLVLFLMTIGLYLRVLEIDYQALKTDEITNAFQTQAILETGFPSIGSISPHLAEKATTTSEIIPYLKVPTGLIFGFNEVGMRLPGVLFSTLTIALLYWVGKSLFDCRVGLLAAAIYTGFPFSISISHYARYPSILEFFALLTTFLFYKSTIPSNLDKKYLWLTLAAFIFTYLCWETSIVLLPGLFAGLLIIKGKDLNWLKNKDLWVVLGVFTIVVFLQLSHRFLVNQNIMSLGSGMKDVTLQPLWLQPSYSPWTFFNRFFFVGHNTFLSILLLLGGVFFIKEKAFSYFLVILLTTGLLWENFVQALATRHFYYLSPILILSASYILFKLLDLFASGIQKPYSMASKVISNLNGTAVVTALLFATNAYGFKFNKYEGLPLTTGGSIGMGVNGGIVEAIKNIQLRPDDKIISTFPHDTFFYTGKADYYIQTELLLPIRVSNLTPTPVHRITGASVISQVEQLKEVLNNHHRVWLFIQYTRASKQILPGGRFYEADLLLTIKNDMRLAYQDWNIMVYLWEK